MMGVLNFDRTERSLISSLNFKTLLELKQQKYRLHELRYYNRVILEYESSIENKQILKPFFTKILVSGEKALYNLFCFYRWFVV